jgi:putative MFS transporter
VSAPAPDAAAPRRGNPWWIPPFLGRVPDAVQAPALRLLGIISFGLAFDSYDNALMNATISRVAEDLGIELRQVGYYTAVVRSAGVLAFLVVPFADRLGRRRVFLASLIGMAAGYAATGLAQTPIQFVLAQLLTRGSMLTMVSMCNVFVTEEMPAAHRAWAMGTMIAVSGIGYALGMLLFAGVDSLPFGWRALYAVGAVPLLVLPWLRRNLTETRRFEAHRDARVADGAALGGWLRPVVELAKSQPRRAAAVGAAGLLAAVGGIAAFQYMIFLLERVHGWQPWAFSVLFIGGGAVGIAGNAVAGRLADKFGRRVVGCVSYLLLPLAVTALYNGPGWMVVLAWIGMVVFGTAGDVVVRVLATELFPTASRGSAAGWLTLLQSVGWATGLLLIGLADVDVERLGLVVPGVSVLCALGGLALLTLPETRSMELEAISTEPGSRS